MSRVRKHDQFILRLPDGMREQIREAAAANNRSMNSEAVARLEASLLLDGNVAPVISAIENLMHALGRAAAMQEDRR